MVEVLEMKPNWSDSPSWANYLAQDEDGNWFWYTSKPTPCVHVWGPENDLCAEANVRNSNWQETLEERPVEAEEGK